MNPEFTNGVTLMLTGIVVVMAILALLALSIEAVIMVDNWMKARARAKDGFNKEAIPSETRMMEFLSDEEAAAIGLALHEYIEMQYRQAGVLNISGPEASRWSASGRQGIMASRLNVILRGK